MNKRVYTLLLGLLLSLSVGTAAWAAADGMDTISARHEKMAKKMDKELNLSVDQQKQLKDFRAAQRTVMGSVLKRQKEALDALKGEFSKPQSDRTVIDSLAAELKELSSQLVDLRTAAMMKMKEVLSPEQFKQFNEIAEKRHNNKRMMLSSPAE